MRRARLLVALVPLVACTHSAPAPSPSPAAREGYVDTPDGARLFYRVLGTGRDTALVLHGGPGFDQSYLAPDFGPLAARHVLVFYDQRGSGRSTVTTDSTVLTAARFVEDLDAVRAHFGLRTVRLIGHSWGAGLAGLYAMAHPERVSALVVANAIPPRRGSYLAEFGANLRARRDSASAARLPVLLAAMRAAPDSAYVTACNAYNAVFILSYYADTTALRRAKGSVCAAPVPALRNLSRVNGSVFASLGDWDWRPALAKVPVRTLVLHADGDPIPVAAAREWAAALPNARLLVIPGGGHFAYVERPEAYFGALDAFLRGEWPAGAEVVRTP